MVKLTEQGRYTPCDVKALVACGVHPHIIRLLESFQEGLQVNFPHHFGGPNISF